MPILISEEDAHLLAERTWSINAGGYAVTWEGKTALLLHRLITKAPPHLEVDHINGDGSDNRRENLRVCTHAQNMRNRRLQKNNKSGYPNVYFEPARADHKATFTVQVKVDGRKVRRGGFNTAEEAYEIAKQLVRSLHGDFSKVNRFEAARMSVNY